MKTTTHHSIRGRLAGAALTLGLAATGGTLAATHAGAATPSQWASGWLTRSPSGGVSSWVSTGAKAQLLDVGGGIWKVTFPGITGGFGVPAVTPGNDLPGGSCTVDTWTALSGNAEVTFHCVSRSGAPAKSGFSVSYTSNPGAVEGWAYAQLPNAQGDYTPVLAYDANGGSVTVNHGAVNGSYLVTFDLIEVFPSDGAYTANAVGSTYAHCTVKSLDRYPTKTALHVWCAQADGTPANVPFVAHLVGNRALMGTPTPKAGWAHDTLPNATGSTIVSGPGVFTSNAQSVSVAHPAHGTYKFTFAGLAWTRSRMAHAAGPALLADVSCTTSEAKAGADAVVTVKCRDELGDAVDVPVDVEYEAV
jgi:hypothetical protein